MLLGASTSEWPEAGFAGIRINPESLLPEIVNAEVCAAALAATTDPADLIYVRLVEGRTAEAAELLAAARCRQPSAIRLRLFEAVLLRMANRLDASAELYAQLLAETQGTLQEAAVLQHQGRSHFAVGNYAAAVDSLAAALDLRVAAADDAALIYASTVALQRARHMLEQEG